MIQGTGTNALGVRSDFTGYPTESIRLDTMAAAQCESFEAGFQAVVETTSGLRLQVEFDKDNCQSALIRKWHLCNGL